MSGGFKEMMSHSVTLAFAGIPQLSFILFFFKDALTITL
jgi:hypothetical protein